MNKVVSLIFFISLAFSLTIDEAKHLLGRTSLGYNTNTLNIFLKYSKNDAVKELLSNTLDKSTYELDVNDFKRFSLINYKNLNSAQKKMNNKERKFKHKALQEWWFDMMLDSKYGFREKMTLFWHNHFTPSFKKVKNHT